MNQTIFAAVLTMLLGISLSFPLKTCDKLRSVKEGAENYNLYLVKLREPKDYMDAEHIINVVKQYQTTLEQHASNVRDPLVKSKLALTETAGLLHGTLSQQALFLVCLESRVEVIFPDYPRSHVDPIDCPKLVLKESYHGHNYSITFRRKTTLNTLYWIITKMELAKLNDGTIKFNYYHSIRKGKKIIMVAEMNQQALHMVCEEKKVKQIKPKYDKSVTSKRDTAATSDQNSITTTTLNDHCDLSEHNEEFPTFIFVYNKATNLDKIIKSVKSFKRSSARVLLATAVEQAQMIIFQMNRAAYLQACRNPEITLVEYAQPFTISQPEPTPRTSSSNPLPTEATDVCQHIDSLQDETNTYTVSLNRPRTVKNRRKQCLKLIKKLTRRSKNTFFAVTYPQQSCQINGNDIKLVAKLNLKALKYVCALKRLQISVTQS